MDRIIKFKRSHFFDAEKTKFSHFDEWGFGININGHTPNFVSPSTNNAALFFSDLQFTELKDKNGKEIYEGDIMKHVSNGSTTTKKVIYCNQHGAFIMKCDKYWEPLCATYGDENMYADEYIIIGNIHETPELLK